jgi:glutamine amidotransferase
MISILDYGMGNLASILNMFRKVGVSGRVIATAREVQEARALVIPGVGKFDNAMRQIESMGLRCVLDEAALSRKIPILGICLGMQLMTRGSEEGQLPGLGWIKADTRLIEGAGQGLRVPHMGWNLANVEKTSPYFDDGLAERRFYFVHSYAVRCDDPADVLTTTGYAGEFVSAFSSGNLVGVQFHPEKSHKFGASFFRHYAAAHKLTRSCEGQRQQS